MLTEVDGQPLLRIERFRKRQPKGEPIMFPVSWWGKSCEDLWLQNWNLLDMLSVPGSSPFLVVAVSEATYPATVLLRWVREGTVCQHSSYLFLAQNPYLAQMEVKRSHPLSQIAQQVFDAVLNGERQINEGWLTRKIREQVLTRILLLLEQVGVPPQRDIDYIVPESIEDAFFWNGFIRKKQERDRRFDWLVTKTAISSFRSGGVLVDVGLGNRLHFDGREIKEVLEQAKEEAEQRNADHYDLVRVGLDSLNRIARAQLG
jgi:hypothetical protein